MRKLLLAMLVLVACEPVHQHRPDVKCARWTTKHSYGLRTGFGFNPFNGMKFEFGPATYGDTSETYCTRWVKRPRT